MVPRIARIALTVEWTITIQFNIKHLLKEQLPRKDVFFCGRRQKASSLPRAGEA